MATLKRAAIRAIFHVCSDRKIHANMRNTTTAHKVSPAYLLKKPWGKNRERRPRPSAMTRTAQRATRAGFLGRVLILNRIPMDVRAPPGRATPGRTRSGPGFPDDRLAELVGNASGQCSN